MAVRGEPLDLSDDELEAQAEVDPERDLPSARDWNERNMPSPYDGLNTARPDPNDPATPDEETEGEGEGDDD